MLDKLIGNSDAKAHLRHLMKEGRVPQSLLLAGPEGVGKKHFAIEIARARLCAEQNGEACGVCAPCERVGKFDLPTGDNADTFERVIFSEHPDVGMVIPFRRNIRINAIRDLEREANFNPFEGSGRFFVIDEAEKLNDAAANALLKTLEEPAPTTNIILVTSRPDSLLPTIRSRCQMLRFARVPNEDIEKFLVNKKEYTPDRARIAAGLSRGSVGRALSIDIEASQEQRRIMYEVLEAAAVRRDLAGVLRLSDTLSDAKHKDQFESNLEMLESLIHDIWIAAASGDRRRISNIDMEDEILRITSFVTPAELAKWLEAIDDLRRSLGVNINRRMATDAMFAKFAAGGSAL